MKQHRLKPILHRDAYTRAIERELLAYFEETLFAPLQDVFDEAKAPMDIRQNSEADDETVVATALKNGSLWYSSGEFIGHLSARLSRALRAIGAVINKAGNFVLTINLLPIAIRGAIEQSLARGAALNTALLEILSQIAVHAKNATTGLATAAAPAAIIKHLEKQFDETVLAIDFVEITAELTPAMEAALRADYTHNLDLTIKNFLAEEIPKLRAIVEKNAFAGYRASELVEEISARFGVTRRKAAFLAEQETSLLVSKFREQRYKSAGVQNYIWATSHDERVREDHRTLDGKQFSFDAPPITNRATGARNNPGEDFRCRCVAIPVIEAPE